MLCCFYELVKRKFLVKRQLRVTTLEPITIDSHESKDRIGIVEMKIRSIETILVNLDEKLNFLHGKIDGKM